MRASNASSAACVKLAYVRTTPGSVSDVSVNSASLPKYVPSTTTAAGLTVAWPDGYSGKLGVTSSGVQVASSIVAGLPSVLASRMAVMGRQKTYVYLASQHEMTASAMATFKSAINRAFSDRVVWRSAATDVATRFQ